MLLLDAFNKDRVSLPQPLQNPPQLAPPPTLPPDPRTQEMINEKLRKAEDLGRPVLFTLQDTMILAYMLFHRCYSLIQHKQILDS